MKGKISIILVLSLLLTMFTVPIDSMAAISISKKKATMEVDSVLTLKVNGLQEGSEVKWTTSKKAVATVGATTGKVTAKSEGSATITATAGEKKYTCTVKVLDSNKPATTATAEPTKAPKPTATSTPKPTPTQVVEKNQSVTVHITNTGSKYHKAGCRYLSKSDTTISLKNAKTRGYTPCSVCKPPN